MPRFDAVGNVAANGNGEEIGLLKWHAKLMSNYLRHLLSKELDTDPDKTEKSFKSRFVTLFWEWANTSNSWCNQIHNDRRN